jgi:hypothetical protein
MPLSDDLARKAKNLPPGWARGFLKAAANIERRKEFAKAWNLGPPNNPFAPPPRNPNSSNYFPSPTNRLPTAPPNIGYPNSNHFPSPSSKLPKIDSSYSEYTESVGSRIGNAVKLLFKIAFWFIVAIFALSLFLSYMAHY